MSTWTQDEIAYVRKLASDGHSSMVISRKMDRSRNAVIGICHRSKIQLKGGMRQADISIAANRAKNERGGIPRKVAPVVKSAPSHLNAGNIAHKKASRDCDPGFAFNYSGTLHSVGLPLESLRANQCRFAVNDAAGDELHLFCGAQRERGPYCGFHASLAYQAPSERRRAA